MFFQNREFSDATELVDGNSYASCKFDKCELVYRGGPIPSIQGCQFNDCTWRFENAAERTLGFMQLLYHGMGVGGAELVEGAFKEIRKPPSDPQKP